MKKLRLSMAFPPPGFLEGSVYKEQVYIGTDRPLAEGLSMKPEGGSKYGIYVTPRSRYARLYGRNLNKAFVSMLKPLVVVDKSEISPGDLTKADINRLRSQGYDSIVSSSSGQLEKAAEFVLFDSEQVWITG